MSSIYDPPSIKSVDDIIYVIKSLSNNSDDLSIDTNFSGLSENETPTTYHIKANVKHKSKKETLRDGFELIKARMNIESASSGIVINGRECKPYSLKANVALPWLDQLIERWLGATRNCVDIIWHINGDEYKYNIFEDKLYKE
jgi:hypothetical protein